MKHGKKLTGLVMAGIMTAGVLTGCTNEPSANTASDTKTEDQSAKSETASQEQITLRFMWWGGDERNEATRTMNQADGANVEKQTGMIGNSYEAE